MSLLATIAPQEPRLPRIAGQPFCIPSARRLPRICWRYTVVIFFAKQFRWPWQEQLRKRQETRLAIPERPILNAHKRVMLLHKPPSIKDTCSTENF
jgi:hypothetical protein